MNPIPNKKTSLEKYGEELGLSIVSLCITTPSYDEPKIQAQAMKFLLARGITSPNDQDVVLKKARIILHPDKLQLQSNHAFQAVQNLRDEIIGNGSAPNPEEGAFLLKSSLNFFYRNFFDGTRAIMHGSSAAAEVNNDKPVDIENAISHEECSMYPSVVTTNAQLYGFKTANLMYLREAIFKDDKDILIPPFVPISKESVIAHMGEHATGWTALWQAFANAQKDHKTIDEESAQILQQIQHLIKQAFNEHPFLLGEELGAHQLMIRSTGNEDRMDVANPGGNESVPSNNNPVKISCAIGDVIASYFSTKSMSQRLLSGEKIHPDIPTLACLIQVLVGEDMPIVANSKPTSKRHLPPVSGVIYTDQGNIHMQVAPGHGELVVNSKGNFDDIYVTHGNSVYKVVSEKKFRLVPEINTDTNRIELVCKENPTAVALTGSFSDQVAIKIAEAARRIERAYGMKMDIEFVYNPNTKKIYIVQARALVDGSKHGKQPNAVSKDYIASHPNLPQQKGEMITTGVMYTALVRQKNEILVCDLISQALSIWIHQKDIIKAVVVRNYASSTSHEAGMFDSKGIPVLQVNDIDAVKDMIAKLSKNGTLILDPQHSTIFQIPGPDLELVGDANPIQEGIYSSLLTDRVTPSKRTRPPTDSESVMIKKLLTELNTQDDAARKKYKSFREIKDDLNRLSLISDQAEHKNTLKGSLSNLLRFAYDSRRKNGAISPELFSKIFETGALLLQKINEIEFTSDPKINQGVIKRYLNIQKKFEGLFLSKNKNGVLSTSVIRELVQTLHAKQHPVPGGLDGKQLEYYCELIKLGDLIAVAERKTAWHRFCEDICRSGKASKLAELVSDLVRQAIHEYWINGPFFAAITSNSGINNEALLDDLYNAHNDKDTKAARDELFSASKRIDLMETQIDMWSSTGNFDTLIEGFKQEVSEIDAILLKKQAKPSNVMLRSNVADKLVDVFDKAIKALQHGQYNPDQKIIQVQRFRIMITEFVNMLNRRVEPAGYCLIRELLELKIDDEHQLDITPDFNVTMANPLSSASTCEANISRAFSDPHTLADMHSVIHQALMSYNAWEFAQYANDFMNFLPSEMKEIFKQMDLFPILQLNRQYPRRCQLKLPEITITYNIPLGNHAAQLYITYDVKKETFRIKLEGYGGYCPWFWCGPAAKIFRDASETNAVIHRCDILKQGFVIEATAENPDDYLKLFQAFSDHLPVYQRTKPKLCPDMPPDFQKMSDGISNLFMDIKTFDDNLKNLFLTKDDRETIHSEISRFEISEDKKDILRTYNGMALIKIVLLDEQTLQDLSRDKLHIMCSDALMSVYIYKDAFTGLQDVSCEATRNELTSDNARRCYMAGVSYDELSKIYDDDRDKFTRMIKLMRGREHHSRENLARFLHTERDPEMKKNSHAPGCG